ncbi:MAG: 5-oxoprolinase subunit PxpB [Desulfotomaculales bacterium]
MAAAWPRFLMAGDRGVIVECGDKISERVNRRVHLLAERIAGLEGVTELVPAYRSLLLCYDPGKVTYAELLERIKERVSSRNTGKKGRLVEIPVCYGGEYGPDLNFVAKYHGLSKEEVVALHAQKEYQVYMVGFLPGFPYLGSLPARIATPRLENPRTNVLAGSVGIGGRQTGVYPVDSPGGWRIIGRTPLKIFDLTKDPPALFSPGDRVRFVPIGEEEFARLAGNQGEVSEEEVPAMEVLFPGLLTTVQDLGRHGYRKYGVPPGGAADPFALRVANILVGNDEGAAGLEITVDGPVLRFLREALIAVTGMEVRAALNEREVPGWAAFRVKEGDVLSIRDGGRGCRAYLAVEGGIAVPKVMGSRATCIRAGVGGYAGRPLKERDVLKTYRSAAAGKGNLCGLPLPREFLPELKEPCTLRVIPGPREEAFSPRGLRAFFASEFTVSPDADKMGLRLDGEKIEHRGRPEIISEGTVPGMVQVPGEGRPIVLFVDAQTIGGYPQIATVISADLARIGQLRPGDRVRFAPVSLEEAQALQRREEEKIARLKKYLGL